MNKPQILPPGVGSSDLDVFDPSAAELDEYARAWDIEVHEVDPLLEELEMLKREVPSNLAQLRQQKAEIMKLEAEIVVRRSRAGHQAPSAVGSSTGSPAFVDAANAKPRRDNPLWPLIQKAQKASAEPWRASLVWAALHEMATSKNGPPYPLLGVDDDTLKWDYHGEVRWLTRNALNERLRREEQRLGLGKTR